MGTPGGDGLENLQGPHLPLSVRGAQEVTPEWPRGAVTKVEKSLSS